MLRTLSKELGSLAAGGGAQQDGENGCCSTAPEALAMCDPCQRQSGFIPLNLLLDPVSHQRPLLPFPFIFLFLFYLLFLIIFRERLSFLQNLLTARVHLLVEKTTTMWEKHRSLW